MRILDNFEVKTRFQATAFGVSIDNEEVYNHLGWVFELFEENGYFNDGKADNFNIKSFVIDYKCAFEKFRLNCESFCLQDLENDIHSSIISHDNFKDFQFALTYDWYYQNLDNDLKSGKYFN